mgnify:CR=1 FL=1
MEARKNSGAQADERVNDLNAKINTYKQENDALKKEIEQLKSPEVWSHSDASQWEGSFYGEITVLKKKVADRDAQIKELEAKLKDGGIQDASAADDTEHLEQIHELMDRVKNLEIERDQARELVRASKVVDLQNKKSQNTKK